MVKLHPATILSFPAKDFEKIASGKSRDDRLAGRQCWLVNTSAAQSARWYDSLKSD
jgi:hypothetical protein